MEMAAYLSSATGNGLCCCLAVAQMEDTTRGGQRSAVALRSARLCQIALSQTQPARKRVKVKKRKGQLSCPGVLDRLIKTTIIVLLELTVFDTKRLVADVCGVEQLM